MANTATELHYTALDERVIDIGRLDAELSAAYQHLIEELDYAGELFDDRAAAVLAGLDAVLAALRASPATYPPGDPDQVPAAPVEPDGIDYGCRWGSAHPDCPWHGKAVTH